MCHSWGHKVQTKASLEEKYIGKTQWSRSWSWALIGRGHLSFPLCFQCSLESREGGWDRWPGEGKEPREKPGLGSPQDTSWGVTHAEKVGLWILCILQEKILKAAAAAWVVAGTPRSSQAKAVN